MEGRREWREGGSEGKVECGSGMQGGMHVCVCVDGGIGEGGGGGGGEERRVKKIKEEEELKKKGRGGR